MKKEKIQIKIFLKDRPYIEIIFPEGDISNITVTENYFSYEHIKSIGKTQKKEKVSLLRADKVDQSGFHERRWFKDDQYRKLPILPNEPEVKVSSSSEEDARLAHVRQIHFNTSAKDTVIKWHFSNYTVKNNQDGELGTADDKDGDLYRDLGKKAVEIFNRAFEIITEEYCLSKGEKEGCKTIQVELVEDEEKSLGDLRYNLLNLVNEDGSLGSRLLGTAPSFTRSDTGQIIATTTNVFIHNNLRFYRQKIEDYIRYEIFKNRDNSNSVQVESCDIYNSNLEECRNPLIDNKEHAVSSYLKSKIESRCSAVTDFIIKRKEDVKAGTLKPANSLNDSDLLEECSRKVSEEGVLGLILHEMGHSFGLGHNFKASVDSKNYYKNWEEVIKYFGEELSGEKPSELVKIVQCYGLFTWS